MNQILQSFDIIIESRLWKELKPSKVLQVLMYMNNKGWLYLSGDAVIGAYRIPSVTVEHMDILPRNEMGNILYVPLVLSLNKNTNIFKDVRREMRKYLEKNIDIIEIVLQGKDDKIRRYKIGVSNGKIKEFRFTSNAHVSAKS